MLLLLLAVGDAGGQRQQTRGQGRDVEQRKEKVDGRQERKEEAEEAEAEEEEEAESRDGRSWFVSCSGGLLALALAVAGQIAASRRKAAKKDGWSASRLCAADIEQRKIELIIKTSKDIK